jgi:VanZ family protein
MRSLKLTGLWQAIGWVYVTLVIYYSLVPSPPDLPGFQGADKLAHLGAYAIMMLWFGFIYLPGPRLLILGALFVLLGMVLDLVQGATGYRSTEPLDMISNACGVCVGGLLARTRLASTLVWLEDRLYGGSGSRKRNH